jgi:hypothetical protein
VVGAISAQGEAKLPVLLFPDKGPLRYDLYVEQLLAYEQLLYLAIEGIDEPTLETQLHRFTAVCVCIRYKVDTHGRTPVGIYL